MSALVLLAQRFGFLEANTPWFGLISLIGVLALPSMDMGLRRCCNDSYRSFAQRSVFLSGLFFIGLVWFAIVVGLTKAVLYLFRKWRFSNDQEKHPVGLVQRRLGFNGVNSWKLSSLRVGIGLLFPWIIWTVAGPATATFLLCVVGELINRPEFYEEVEIITPKYQANTDLATAVRNRPPNSRPI